MKDKTVGLDESELNARGDHVRPSDGRRSLKRESPDYSHRVCQLDNAATSPLAPGVYEAMDEWYQKRNIGNPGSLHTNGVRARKAVENAREQVAALINANPDEIYFTSCGTESNNTWFRLLMRGDDLCQVYTSRIEHKSILEPLAESDFVIPTKVKVDKNGVVDLNYMKEWLKLPKRTPTSVSVMWVNNEIGTVEPIREIGELCQEHSVLFHTDAVQAAGHVPIDVKANYIDALSMSGHKFGAPLGIGALYISDKVRTNTPLIVGGGQERGLRAGTENVPGIVGMGVAAEYAMRTLDDHRDMWKTYRELMLEGLSELLPGQFTVNGGDKFSNILSLTFPGAQSESLLLLLDQEDVYVSAGAACSAGSGSPSHVLTAIGLSDALAACTIRISMGFDTTRSEIVEATKKIAKCVERVKSFQP